MGRIIVWWPLVALVACKGGGNDKAIDAAATADTADTVDTAPDGGGSPPLAFDVTMIASGSTYGAYDLLGTKFVYRSPYAFPNGNLIVHDVPAGTDYASTQSVNSISINTNRDRLDVLVSPGPTYEFVEPFASRTVHICTTCTPYAPRDLSHFFWNASGTGYDLDATQQTPAQIATGISGNLGVNPGISDIYYPTSAGMWHWRPGISPHMTAPGGFILQVADDGSAVFYSSGTALYQWRPTAAAVQLDTTSSSTYIAATASMDRIAWLSGTTLKLWKEIDGSITPIATNVNALVANSTLTRIVYLHDKLNNVSSLAVWDAGTVSEVTTGVPALPDTSSATFTGYTSNVRGDYAEFVYLAAYDSTTDRGTLHLWTPTADTAIAQNVSRLARITIDATWSRAAFFVDPATVSANSSGTLTIADLPGGALHTVATAVSYMNTNRYQYMGFLPGGAFLYTKGFTGAYQPADFYLWESVGDQSHLIATATRLALPSPDGMRFVYQLGAPSYTGPLHIWRRESATDSEIEPSCDTAGRSPRFTDDSKHLLYVQTSPGYLGPFVDWDVTTETPTTVATIGRALDANGETALIYDPTTTCTITACRGTLAVYRPGEAPVVLHDDVDIIEPLSGGAWSFQTVATDSTRSLWLAVPK